MSEDLLSPAQKIALRAEVDQYSTISPNTPPGEREAVSNRNLLLQILAKATRQSVDEVEVRIALQAQKEHTPIADFLDSLRQMLGNKPPK